MVKEKDQRKTKANKKRSATAHLDERDRLAADAVFAANSLKAKNRNASADKPKHSKINISDKEKNNKSGNFGNSPDSFLSSHAKNMHAGENNSFFSSKDKRTDSKVRLTDQTSDLTDLGRPMSSDHLYGLKCDAPPVNTECAEKTKYDKRVSDAHTVSEKNALLKKTKITSIDHSAKFAEEPSLFVAPSLANTCNAHHEDQGKLKPTHAHPIKSHCESIPNNPKCNFGHTADNYSDYKNDLKSSKRISDIDIQNHPGHEKKPDNTNRPSASHIKSHIGEEKNTNSANSTFETQIPSCAGNSKKISRNPIAKNLFRNRINSQSFIKLFTKQNPKYDPKFDNSIVSSGKDIKNKKYIFSLSRSFKTLAEAAGIMVLCIFIYTGAVILTAPKIEPSKIYEEIATSTTIYDDNGKAFDTVNYGQDRTIIKYKNIPKNTVNAFVALEDKTFWKHHGFNWKRMIGAVLQSITGHGSISGTSTITQQLARNVYLPNIKSERSIRRKIIEMYYSAKIEHSLSKKEILAAYLNSIYFGFGTYGIENASRTYFNKSVKDLNLIESAALAALPQSPDTYALIRSFSDGYTTSDSETSIKINNKNYICNDISIGRRQLCLSLMREQGYIDDNEWKTNSGKKLSDFLSPNISKSQKTKTTYFTDYVTEVITKDLMNKYNISNEKAQKMVYAGGLKIYSTMDSEAQNSIEKEFTDDYNFPKLYDSKKNSSGDIVSKNGDIILYKYDNMFDGNGNFILKKSEYKRGKDGSLIIKQGKRLNIYRTETAEGIDYSLQFKPSYVKSGGDMYIYPSGYINIPANKKTLDKNGNLVVDWNYIKSESKSFLPTKSSIKLTSSAYSLDDKIIQPQAAMVITEVGTGKLKAMVGGRGITDQQSLNRAVAYRQPGSSIKPLSVYSAALQRSHEYAEKEEKYPLKDFGNDTQGTKYYGDYLTAGSTILDEPIRFDGKIWPKNSYNGYRGMLSMRQAITTSCNVCAVKLYEQIGSEYSAKMLNKYGISSIEKKGKNNDMNAAALALGGLASGVSPLEMAQAYATFPNGGYRNKTIVYSKVVDKNGKTILRSEPKENKVLDNGVAYIMRTLLQSVVSRGTGINAHLYGVEAGGKTGTTSSEYDIWFDGFTPKYSASLWMGSDINIQLTSDSSSASALWGKIMRAIPAASRGEYKTQPENVLKINGEYYTRGTEKGLSSARHYGSSNGKSSGNAKPQPGKKINNDNNGDENKKPEKPERPSKPADKKPQPNKPKPADPKPGTNNPGSGNGSGSGT